jgi:hypothetical protein
VPWIIDYAMVLEQMKSQGFKSLYYNSGAFGFGDTTGVQTLAWVGPEDASIRAAAQLSIRRIAEPYEDRLAHMAGQLWQRTLGGRAWIMPMSHWAYELDHGSRDWMPALIENLDLDPGLLANRNNGAAIEFAAGEVEPFEHMVERLLMMLMSSDFMIAFPGKPVLCTLHHHKQLWWMSTDAKVIEAVEALGRENAPPS